VSYNKANKREFLKSSREAVNK